MGYTSQLGLVFLYVTSSHLGSSNADLLVDILKHYQSLNAEAQVLAKEATDASKNSRTFREWNGPTFDSQNEQVGFSIVDSCSVSRIFAQAYLIFNCHFVERD